jgi:hypothetical protein
MVTPSTRKLRLPATVLAAFVVAALGLAGCQVPLGPVTPTSVEAVRLPGVRDASVVFHDGWYYVYGMTSRTSPWSDDPSVDNAAGRVLAPVTRLRDLEREYSVEEIRAATSEAMPTVPPFMNDDGMGARTVVLFSPTVARFGATWVMYFETAAPWVRYGPVWAGWPCLARATAPSPAGPFEGATIVNCGPTDSGTLEGRLLNEEWGGNGAHGPSLFTAADGRPRLLFTWTRGQPWESNGGEDVMSVPLDGSGVPAGPVVRLLAGSAPWEGAWLGHPSMVYDRDRRSYLLAYVAQGEDPKVGTARCTTPAGPCIGDPTGPWLTSGNGRELYLGLEFFVDGAGAQRAVYGSQVVGDPSTRAQSVVHLRTDPSVTLSIVK